MQISFLLSYQTPSFAATLSYLERPDELDRVLLYACFCFLCYSFCNEMFCFFLPHCFSLLAVKIFFWVCRGFSLEYTGPAFYAAVIFSPSHFVWYCMGFGVVLCCCIVLLYCAMVCWTPSCFASSVLPSPTHSTFMLMHALLRGEMHPTQLNLYQNPPRLIIISSVSLIIWNIPF